MTITVLESFEPYTSGGGGWQGDLFWIDSLFGFSNTVVTSSTLNVTQGTKTWKAITSGANRAFGSGLQGGSGTDLTGYVSLIADVFIAQAGGGQSAISIIDNGTGTEVFSNFTSGTGAKTVTIDLTTAGIALNDLTFNLYGGTNAFGGSGTAVSEVYWDNLRADDGASSGVTATAAITQASQTISSAAKLALKATSSITQASNTIASAAKLALKATASITQASNTVASAGVLAIKASASITQADNTLSSAATMPSAGINGNLSATQSDNTLSSVAKLAIKATAAITQADNTLSSTGKAAIKATLSVTQAGNTLSATGKLPIKANLAVTQAGNTVSSTASIAGQLVVAGRRLAKRRQRAHALMAKYEAARELEHAQEHIAPAVEKFIVKKIGVALPQPEKIDFEALERDRAARKAFEKALAKQLAQIAAEEEEIFNFIMLIA